MIKNYFIPAFFAAGIFALTACNSENEENEQNAQLSITTDIATRSIITGTSFSTGDEIGVYAINASGTAYSPTSMNMRAKLGTSWGFPNGSIYLKTSPATIYAYYPYAPTNSVLSVPLDISYDSTNGQTDYLYGTGTATVNATSPSAHIDFNHALARLTFNVKVDNESVGTNVLTDVRLMNTTGDTAVAVKGTMNITTGAIKRTVNTYDYIEQSMNKTLDAAKASEVDFLIMPVTVNNDMNVVMEIDGKMYAVKLPTTTLKAGSQYNYPVTISVNNQRITIGDCSITQWNSNDATSVSVTTDNYTISVPDTVDLGLSVKWATFNIGATKPEESGSMYNYGALTEDNNSYYNSNSNISGDVRYDVVRAKLGENWRMPTGSEIGELTNTSNCTWEWTSVNGVNGYKVTSKKTGFEGRSIFLPAAGHITSSVLQDQNIKGSYWYGSSANYFYNTGYEFTYLSFSSSSYTTNYLIPENRLPIRPVFSKQ
jgi:hypothetical protein